MGSLSTEQLDITIVDLFDEHAAKTPDRIAAEWEGQSLTYSQLRYASLHAAKALLAAGVQPRDKIPIVTQMSLEMLPAVIGILRVGACYAPMDVAVWGQARVEAALSQLSAPIAIVTASCPGLQLPAITVNFQQRWLSDPVLDDRLILKLGDIRRAMRADDLAWVIFTSGTTGKPKGVMIYHRAISALAALNHGDELEAAAARGIRCLLAFSIAFDGCAAVVWTTLTKGGTLAMASPSNFPDIASKCDLLHLTPSMLAILDPSGPYESVRYIFLGAEAPNLDVVRRWITPNRKVLNTYGPSETTCIISLGELKPDEEPPFGDLLPGVTLALVDEDLRECDYGEVLIAGPGVAAGYLGNPELTAQKFIWWKGQRFYRTGDMARRTVDGQYLWAGRADSLVKNRGFLINLETEVEPAMLSFPGVERAVAMKWQDRLIGFVQPSTIDVEELRHFIKAKVDPFVVPDQVLAVATFPLNANSKTDRRALVAQLDERASQAESGWELMGHDVSSYDALRMAFAVCLHVPFNDINSESSFTRLGGNSLAAIRLANELKQHGHWISVAQVLKLDTVGQLQDNVVSLAAVDEGQEVNGGGYSSEPIPATDVQRAMLSRSFNNTSLYALIGTAKYIGDIATIPSADELRSAFSKALKSHSIFHTRYNLNDMTFSHAERQTLDWHQVTVQKRQDFDSACEDAEARAWLDLKNVTPADLEVPYFHVTCVAASDGNAIAFITRVHHALTDVFSSAIFLRDVEQVLAGKAISPGPRFQDYAKFMLKYKQANLDKAALFFKDLVKLLPTAAVLQPPVPEIQLAPDAMGLLRLPSPCAVSKSALDQATRSKGITASTIVYAAWSLFLAKISGWDRVGFSLSMSGRTIPWPWAEEIVGPLTTRAPFSTTVPASMTVDEWLSELHQKTLDVLSFDGLMHSLPDCIMQDERTKSTVVLCLLDMPLPSANWTFSDKQDQPLMMMWHVAQHGDELKTEVDYNLRRVDVEWANEVKTVPGKMVDALVTSSKTTLVGDLLKF